MPSFVSPLEMESSASAAQLFAIVAPSLKETEHDGYYLLCPKGKQASNATHPAFRAS
jgi:hypothetical protein